MPWFKVDDTLASHPKARAAGLAAMGLWVVAGAYASQYLTGGQVPRWFVDSWPSGRRLADRLVDAGLWLTCDDGWNFHQWDERQPTKDQVEADREAARQRVKRWRAAKRGNGVTPTESNAVTPAVRNGVSNASPTRPDPTVVPTELPTTTAPQKRGARIPDDFAVTDEMHQWATENVPRVVHDLDAATREFVDYWRATPGSKGTKLDWTATWRNRMRQVQERREHVRPIRDHRSEPTSSPEDAIWRQLREQRR